MEKELSVEQILSRNGKEVILKNPGTKGLKDFLILAKAMSGDANSKPEDFFDNLTDEAMDSAINLVTLSVKKTYPEYDDEDDEWATENFMLILPKVIDMCTPKSVSDGTNTAEDLRAKIKSLR